MNDRREFAAALGGLLLAAAGLPAIAAPAASRSGSARAFFESICGHDLEVELGAGRSATLRLLKVRPAAVAARIEQFSIVLRGSAAAAFEGGLYRVGRGPASLPLRLDPSGHDAHGPLYRADFSLLA